MIDAVASIGERVEFDGDKLTRLRESLAREVEGVADARERIAALERKVDALTVLLVGLIAGERLSTPSKTVAAVETTSDVAIAATDGETSGHNAGDLASMERSAIEKALREARFNKSKAARLLGLTRTQLYVRLRKYGMD